MDIFSYSPDSKLDLVLERVIDVPPELVFKGWTEPNYVKQWFAPLPWIVTDCQIDLRPGGMFKTTMRSIEGENYPMEGCYLELVKDRRIVWTDTMTNGYRPAVNPFLTLIVTLEPHEQGTKYTVIARHKDEVDRKKHEEMGFHQGWSICLEQLVDALTKSK